MSRFFWVHYELYICNSGVKSSEFRLVSLITVTKTENELLEGYLETIFILFMDFVDAQSILLIICQSLLNRRKAAYYVRDIIVCLSGPKLL